MILHLTVSCIRRNSSNAVDRLPEAMFYELRRSEYTSITFHRRRKCSHATPLEKKKPTHHIRLRIKNAFYTPPIRLLFFVFSAYIDIYITISYYVLQSAFFTTTRIDICIYEWREGKKSSLFSLSWVSFIFFFSSFSYTMVFFFLSVSSPIFTSTMNF